jgi:hypothetical protein
VGVDPEEELAGHHVLLQHELHERIGLVAQAQRVALQSRRAGGVAARLVDELAKTSPVSSSWPPALAARLGAMGQAEVDLDRLVDHARVTSLHHQQWRLLEDVRALSFRLEAPP